MKRELKVDKTNLSKHKKINIIRITAILKVKPDIANISVSLIEAGIFVIMSVEAFRTDYCFYLWRHNVFYVIFLWIKVSSVIQTFSVSYIKGKMSKLSIKFQSQWFMVLNATFYNISVISWWSVLLVEETGVPRENHWPVTSHWQTLLGT